MCFPLKSTKAPSNQTSASKCTTCSTLQEHQPNSHPKLTKHNVVLLSTIRDCKNRTDSRDREREERRAEQRRGEREREREEREREREERERERTTQKQTQKDSAFHEQRGESGRQRLPAPINSCCNGIRDNLKKVEKARLSFFAKRVLIGSFGNKQGVNDDADDDGDSDDTDHHANHDGDALDSLSSSMMSATRRTAPY